MLAATYAYDPYGTVTSSTGGSVANGNPWRFQSGYFDGGTSLYKFGTRYDDPTLGRWTQQGSECNPFMTTTRSPSETRQVIGASEEGNA